MKQGVLAALCKFRNGSLRLNDILQTTQKVVVLLQTLTPPAPPAPPAPCRVWATRASHDRTHLLFHQHGTESLLYSHSEELQNASWLKPDAAGAGGGTSQGFGINKYILLCIKWASRGAQLVKNLPAMQETPV